MVSPWLVVAGGWLSIGLLKLSPLGWGSIMALVATLLVVGTALLIGSPLLRGLRRLWVAPSAGLGAVLSCGYLTFVVGAYVVVHPESWRFDLPQILNPLALPAASLAAVLVVPFYEEFFFRGALQPRVGTLLQARFDERCAALWSIYIVALLFWVFHAPVHLEAWRVAWARGGIPLSPGPFLLGLVCGFIRWRDASIWFAIIFHALANLLGPLWAGLLPPSILGMFYSVTVGV
jgi:membrane protease YdiL (CAAX protease family)